MKMCPRCRKILPPESFDKSTRHGRQSYCKACSVESTRERRERLGTACRLAEARKAAEKHRLRANKWNHENKEKRVAHLIAQKALKEGIITRAPCEVCGARAVMHHDDYSKPLEVRWFCTRHHLRLHYAISKMIRELGRTAQ